MVGQALCFPSNSFQPMLRATRSHVDHTDVPAARSIIDVAVESRFYLDHASFVRVLRDEPNAVGKVFAGEFAAQ